MEDKYKKLEELYLQMHETDELSYKRYSIDFGVRDRAYTDEENEKEGKLAKEVELRKEQLEKNIKSYAKTFSSLNEFDQLKEKVKMDRSKELENKGYYDQRKYGGMMAIIKETAEEFESLQKLSTNKEQSVENLER